MWDIIGVKAFHDNEMALITFSGWKKENGWFDMKRLKHFYDNKTCFKLYIFSGCKKENEKLWNGKVKHFYVNKTCFRICIFPGWKKGNKIGKESYEMWFNW